MPNVTATNSDIKIYYSNDWEVHESTENNMIVYLGKWYTRENEDAYLIQGRLVIYIKEKPSNEAKETKVEP